MGLKSDILLAFPDVDLKEKDGEIKFSTPEISPDQIVALYEINMDNDVHVKRSGMSLLITVDVEEVN